MKTLNIMGKQYKVRLVERLGCFGCVNLMDHEICIEKKMPKDEQMSTLLHEIIEVIKYNNEMPIEHSAVMMLEAAIYQALTANGVNLAPLLRCLK